MKLFIILRSFWWILGHKKYSFVRNISFQDGVKSVGKTIDSG
ncbi:hypothetical protein RU86_GL001791 [Lactococcus piscium]|uniref:Uncharacterized protein n=1 Tax=Pseudolactococcus piscium TaxID=1364 RepID=A0A2A5RUA1_9LACT|nr:hypothetical protein RU86_GL001791 [Lactococcus piscium]